MLPGFRFLFAAIMLSMSLLIFALGAAALLRSAHEEFASNPSWRAAPEVTFAQSGDTTGSVLAALRVEELPAAEKSQGAPASAASAEETAASATPTGASEEIAASKPEESLPREAEKTANTEGPAGENIAASEAASASTENPAATEPVQAVATRVAAAATIAAMPGDDTPAAVRDDPIAAQLELIDAGAAAKIATLGGPPVDIEETPPGAKAAATKANPSQADQDAAKKKAEAKRAANRRKIAAARAKLAAQQALQPFQSDPFFRPPAQGARAR